MDWQDERLRLEIFFFSQLYVLFALLQSFDSAQENQKDQG
jgi:hypothetical protein